MKKILSILMAIVVLAVPFMTVDAAKAKKTDKKDPVNVYVFHGDGCPHCAELIDYLETLEKDKDYAGKFKVSKYEVWYDENNQEVMTKVASYLDFEVKGVPFYVIGKHTMSGFSSDDSPAEIKKYIDEEYAKEVSERDDVVPGIEDGTITVPDSDLNEKSSKKNNDVVGYIVLGITAIIVIAIIVSRSKSTGYYEDETADDKAKEDVSKETEDDKSTAKKTTKKVKKK